MRFDIVSSEILNDKTKRVILKVTDEDLFYLGYILESFEGWCNYTTIRKTEPFLQIDIAPDYINSTEELLNYLKNWNLNKEEL